MKKVDGGVRIVGLFDIVFGNPEYLPKIMFQNTQTFSGRENNDWE